MFLDWSDRARWTRLLHRPSNGAIPAIIVGDGSTNDLSFVRSLSRHRIPTILILGQRLLGSFSRLGVRIRMPSVEEHPQAWLEVLEFVSDEVGARSVLFALSDAHCAFVSRNSDYLRPMFHFLLPDEGTVSAILDKRKQYCAAQAAGIHVPTTYYPENLEEVAQLSSRVDYPVLLKPYTAHVGRPKISNRKVLVVESAEQLVTAYSALIGSGARFMVQHVVPGSDDAIFWYSGYWDEGSCERAWFMVQKLRQCPPGFGDGSFQRTVENPVVLHASRTLLEAFRYRGLVMVEFKIDPGDGSYYLMEINPRTASGNQLGISAGVDLPWIAYRDLSGLNHVRTPPPGFRKNVKYVNEEWDVQSFAASWRSGELTLVEWIQSLRGIEARALFAWSDPLPLLVGLWRFARSYLLGVLRRDGSA